MKDLIKIAEEIARKEVELIEEKKKLGWSVEKISIYIQRLNYHIEKQITLMILDKIKPIGK
jgi:hypothetical protein